jgi:TolA-binding protein
MNFHNRALRTLTRVLLLIAALAATALGCVWIGTFDSVRFHGYQSEREMGRLPPLPNLANGTNTLRAYWGNEDASGDVNPESDYTVSEKQTRAVEEFWKRAELFEKEGKSAEQADRLIEYLRRTSVARHIWFDPADREHRRNAAIDKLDALTALNQGSSPSHVQAYLAARTLHDDDRPADEIQLALGQAASDVNLKDNVAYLKAAGLYRGKQFEDAARAFNALARKYPQSEKREAALFMFAVATMKTSLAYTPTSGDEAHLHEDGTEGRHEVIIDDEWHSALGGFKRLMSEYPRGRYFNDARGWIAYLMLRKGDRAEALAEYYRLLSDQRDENARIEAAISLEMVRHHATDEELSQVEASLADEPQVALTYAYHSIFNYSIDPGLSYPGYETVNDANGTYDAEASSRLHQQRKQEWSKQRAATGRHTVERILAFSLRLMNRYPSLAIGGAFALRTAEASVELDHNQDAVQFAQRALQSGVQNNERAQTLWTIGLAEHRLKHFVSARKNLETLIRDYPRSNLTEGARRLLAMVAEDSGDIDGALEQYIALDYEVDIAYFIDVLMTIEQLTQFIDRHPDLPEKNSFTYALGLRYLRANRWNEARTTYNKVHAYANPQATVFSMGQCIDISEEDNDCSDPKGSQWLDENDKPVITHNLVLRELQTVSDLERLERAVTSAPDNEAAAEALYQFASYQYEASRLLFYNPILWSGNRYWDLSYLALKGRYRALNEAQNLFAYMQEHDTFARALKIYLEVVDRYPHTRAARDALYTAAVCHERLSEYNAYWRDIYGAGLHAGQRMVTYSDVKAAYPTYQLPRGTYGWQPSTRTVNDGPGWAASPKRVPPPSRWARLKSRLENFYNKAYVFWNETVRRWITMIFLLFGVGFTARIAAQNRKLLRPKIVRVRLSAPAPNIDPPWTTLFWKGGWELGRREKLKRFLTERGIEFWELARDRRSRPILLRNILSHSFLAGLVIGLFWFLHFG